MCMSLHFQDIPLPTFPLPLQTLFEPTNPKQSEEDTSRSIDVMPAPSHHRYRSQPIFLRYELNILKTRPNSWMLRAPQQTSMRFRSRQFRPAYSKTSSFRAQCIIFYLFFIASQSMHSLILSVYFLYPVNTLPSGPCSASRGENSNSIFSSLKAFWAK